MYWRCKVKMILKDGFHQSQFGFTDRSVSNMFRNYNAAASAPA